MKVKTSTGVEIDTEGGFASTATKYAVNKGVKNIICALATHPDKSQTYILLENPDTNPQVIYESTVFEDIAVHIDAISLAGQP